MVQYVGVICFLVCITHYVYQTILLPSYRQSARDELFKLRDELRAQMLKVQGDADKTTMRAFKEVDDGLNRSINRLHLMTFTNFVKVARAQENNQEIDQHFKRFYTLIENASDDMPKETFLAANKVLERVLAMNSLMFVLYLAPVVLVIKLCGTVYNKIKDSADLMVDLCFVDKQFRTKGALSLDDRLTA